MKKMSFILIAALALLITPTFVRAETSSASGSLKETRRENIKQAQEDFKTARTEARENFKQDVTDARQEFRDGVAERHATRLQKRFNIYYTRISQIIAKIQANINDKKTAGKDVTAAQAKLDEAKTALDKAKTLGEQAVQGFSNIDPAKYSEQRSEALKARDLANQARQQFKLALSLMKETVRLLKALK